MSTDIINGLSSIVYGRNQIEKKSGNIYDCSLYFAITGLLCTSKRISKKEPENVACQLRHYLMDFN